METHLADDGAERRDPNDAGAAHAVDEETLKPVSIRPSQSASPNPASHTSPENIAFPIP